MKQLLLTLLISSSLLFISCGKNSSPAENDTDKSTATTKTETSISDTVIAGPPKTSSAESKTLILTEEDKYYTDHLVEGDNLYYIDANTGKLSITSTDLETSYILEENILVKEDYYPQSLVSDNSEIYFNDLTSNNSLYKMNIETEEIELVSNNSFSNIVLNEDVIYYIDKSKGDILCSYNLDDNSTTVLSYSKCGSFILNGNYLLFRNISDNNSLYSIKYDGSNEKKITSSSVESFAVYNENILYIDSSNNNFYYYDIAEESIQKVGLLTGSKLKSINGTYYYIDPNSLNHLYSLSLDDGLDNPSTSVVSKNSTNDYTLTDIGIFLNQGKDINKNHYLSYNE